MFYNNTLYSDTGLEVSQMTGCQFPPEKLPPCWPTPQLPPPLCPDAELKEAVRSASGDVVQVNEYRAFEGQWYLVHSEVVQKHGGMGNVVLFPPYAEKLAAAQAFVDRLTQP